MQVDITLVVSGRDIDEKKADALEKKCAAVLAEIS